MAMASKKRNEWLEADNDEEDSHFSDQEEGRGQAIPPRSKKRRRLAADFLSASEEESGDENDEKTTPETPAIDSSTAETNAAADKAEEEPLLENVKGTKIDRQLIKARDASSRSGVIYISYIPPFMKPHTLKNLISPFAPSGLGRIYLTPEDHHRRESRVKAGGNKKRNFSDGWVEFLYKKEAKIVVETLNTRTIGGKKGGYYFDDVWNLKYLKGFKWRHLTEQIANEQEERAARMRAEASSSKREMREFLRNVESAKIAETRQKKRENRGEAAAVEEAASPEEPLPKRKKKGFNQNVPIEATKRKSGDASEEFKSILLQL